MKIVRKIVIALLCVTLPAGAAAAGEKRAALAAELVTHGVSGEEAGARVAALSDEEVAALAGRVHELPAGGDAGALLLVWFLAFLAAQLVEGVAAIASTAADTVRCGFVDALLRNCPREDR